MKRTALYPAFLLSACLLLQLAVQAQTDADAIMMGKNKFCTGFMYSHSKWDTYWEGTLKRTNENLGTVTTNSVLYMGSYGLTKTVNLIIGLPYVQTKASAGTLKGQKGLQDAMLMAKWKALHLKKDKQSFALFGVAGVTAPVTNYVIDHLPLSLGLGSRTTFVRGIADYQLGKFFVTGGASYHLRSNVEIDRQTYYTTEMHYTNEVEMPNTSMLLLRAGYRSSQLIAEATADKMTTLGGFDIRRNDMPFPSNKMNATRIGVNLKYEPNYLKNLSLTGGFNKVVAGRNMGQATTLYGGIFYIFDFGRKTTNSSQNASTK